MYGTIQFLGCEIRNGHWSLGDFLRQKLAELREVRTIKDLERIIGFISYTRHYVKDVEAILGPLHEGFKSCKEDEVSEGWLHALNEQVKKALEKAIANVPWLMLLRGNSNKFTFVTKTDWSSKTCWLHAFCLKG